MPLYIFIYIMKSIQSFSCFSLCSHYATVICHDCHAVIFSLSLGKTNSLTWEYFLSHVAVKTSRNFVAQEITAFRWFDYGFLVVSLRQTLRVKMLINDFALRWTYQIG